MPNFTEKDIPDLKQVRFYNLLEIWGYLSVRYKVFVKELNRPIIGEFYKDDFYVHHYILEEKNNVIGTLRILYLKDKIAFIGRVAILNNYRNQGYGSLIIIKAIEVAKQSANIIKLFTEEEKIGFYKKFSFIEQNKVYFDDMPYIQMQLGVNKK